MSTRSEAHRKAKKAAAVAPVPPIEAEALQILQVLMILLERPGELSAFDLAQHFSRSHRTITRRLQGLRRLGFEIVATRSRARTLNDREGDVLSITGAPTVLLRLLRAEVDKIGPADPYKIRRRGPPPESHRLY